MPADFSHLKGHRFADCDWSFTPKRISALNLAIGVTENGTGLPPTLAFSADMDHQVVDQLLALTGLGAHQLLHGEQHFHYHHPLQPGLHYSSRAELTEVIKKPRFNLLHKKTRLLTADGSLACEMLSIYVAVPVPGPPRVGPEMAEQNARPVTTARPISREQISAFALASGDQNPVHLEPAIACRAGHADVFAQGMLGMGMLGTLLSATRLQRFGVRFLSPIVLGDQPRLYQTGTQSRELVLTNEQGNIRIRGYAELD
jgi:acyl dehydratase